MSSSVALLVIDAQGRYTLPGAPFEIPHVEQIILGINDLADRARDGGSPVIWITREVRPQVGPGRRTSTRYGRTVSDAFRGEMAEQDRRLRVEDRDLSITKPRQSSFYASELDADLRGLGCESVVLVGFTTNVCVLGTAQDAAARDYDVTVIRDLTAALPITASRQSFSAEAVHETSLAFIEHSIGRVLESSAVRFDGPQDAAQPT